MRVGEKEMIQTLKEQLLGDRRKKYELFMHKRDEFLKDNVTQRREKQEKEESDRQSYKEYRLNFFPFTYGEVIEQHQAELRETRKSEYH